MWLELAKQEKLLTIFKGWVHIGKQGTAGIPFKEFELVTAKLHAKPKQKNKQTKIIQLPVTKSHPIPADNP